MKNHVGGKKVEDVMFLIKILPVILMVIVKFFVVANVKDIKIKEML